MGLNCILKKPDWTDWFKNRFREYIYTHEKKQAILFGISEENLANTLPNSPEGSL